MPPRGRMGRLMPWLAGLLCLIGAGLVVAGVLARRHLEPAAGRRRGRGDPDPRRGDDLAASSSARAARFIAIPIERFTKLVGRLARENATRHPARTAVTSAALMIGLALVVFVTVFADGLRSSVEDLIDRTIRATWAGGRPAGRRNLSTASQRQAQGVAGVDVASPIQLTDVRFTGSTAPTAVRRQPAHGHRRLPLRLAGRLDRRGGAAARHQRRVAREETGDSKRPQGRRQLHRLRRAEPSRDLCAASTRTTRSSAASRSRRRPTIAADKTPASVLITTDPGANVATVQASVGGDHPGGPGADQHSRTTWARSTGSSPSSTRSWR